MKNRLIVNMKSLIDMSAYLIKIFGVETPML